MQQAIESSLEAERDPILVRVDCRLYQSEDDGDLGCWGSSSASVHGGVDIIEIRRINPLFRSIPAIHLLTAWQKD